MREPLPAPPPLRRTRMGTSCSDAAVRCGPRMMAVIAGRSDSRIFPLVVFTAVKTTGVLRPPLGDPGVSCGWKPAATLSYLCIRGG